MVKTAIVKSVGKVLVIAGLRRTRETYKYATKGWESSILLAVLFPRGVIGNTRVSGAFSGSSNLSEAAIGL